MAGKTIFGELMLNKLIIDSPILEYQQTNHITGYFLYRRKKKCARGGKS